MSPTGTGKLVALPTDITQGGRTIYVDARWHGIVTWIAHMFGVVVSSGYRSPADNANTPGAAEHSDHLSGNAIDFVGAGSASLYKWATALNLFPYVEPQSQAKDHVHISFARGQKTTNVAAVMGTSALAAALGATGSASNIGSAGTTGAGTGAVGGADAGATGAAATSGCLIPLIAIAAVALDLGSRYL